MTDGWQELSAGERRGIKFGLGFVFGVVFGFLLASRFTAGGMGATVGVVMASGIGLGVLVAAVNDEIYRRLYKWPWPWRGL